MAPLEITPVKKSQTLQERRLKIKQAKIDRESSSKDEENKGMSVDQILEKKL